MSTPGDARYPTLKEMGIESPQQIDKYHITSMNLVDVLRVIYDRPTGTFLPSHRTYKFPRVQEKATEDGKEDKLRTHPKLVEACKELDALLSKASTKECIKDEIMGEIAQLEEEIAIRSERIRELANRIIDSD